MIPTKVPSVEVIVLEEVLRVCNGSERNQLKHTDGGKWEIQITGLGAQLNL